MLLVCSRRQPCVDHLPLPETPDAFQKEQLGPKWLSSCGGGERTEEKRKKKKHTHECFFHRCLSGHLCGEPSPTQTCRCLRVKITGSDRYTRLEPRCTEAEMTWELTTRLFRRVSEPWVRPRLSRNVEFWVVRKEPRFL